MLITEAVFQASSDSRNLEDSIPEAARTLRRVIHYAILLRSIFWEDGYDIQSVHELLGHRDVSTTIIYTHVLNRGGRSVFKSSGSATKNLKTRSRPGIGRHAGNKFARKRELTFWSQVSDAENQRGRTKMTH